MPSMVDSDVNGTEPSQRQTSVDVPPMSSVMMRSWPAAFAIWNAPATPPAGPERTVRTASEAAAPARALPPFDCMMRSPPTPRDANPSLSRER